MVLQQKRNGMKSLSKVLRLKIERFLYLISPSKINQNFYKDLQKFLSSGKVKYFQLRLKKYSNSKLIKYWKKIKAYYKKI